MILSKLIRPKAEGAPGTDDLHIRVHKEVATELVDTKGFENCQYEINIQKERQNVGNCQLAKYLLLEKF